MKVLLIGSTSLVGRSLRDQLRSAQISYHVFDRKDGFNLFLSKSIEEWKQLLDGYDAIVYLAWTGVPSDSNSSIKDGINVNLRCIREMCTALHELGRGHLIFFSTAGAIYGNHEGIMSEETPCQPLSHYGQTKLAAEQLIRQLSEDGSKFRYHFLRISNIYGPRLKVKEGFDLINHLLQSVYTGKKFSIYGKGDNTRDFIYVDDVSSAVVACLKKEHGSQILNVCNGSSNTIIEVCNAVEAATSQSLNYQKLPERVCDVKHVLLSNDKAIAYLDWRPKYTINEGINSIVSILQSKKLETR